MKYDVGEKYGKWEIITAPYVIGEGRNRRRFVDIKCECGNTSTRPARVIGKTSFSCKSCAKAKHRACNSREYNIWQSMKRRCYDEKHPGFPNYGGRGIEVCISWINSFQNFINDMGCCPENFSIERKDNMMGYSPENCVWASRIVQNRNTRKNVFIEYNGQIKTIAEWSQVTGIKYATIYWRKRKGWPANEVLKP